MYKVIMPKFGETMTEGIIIKWFLKEGQKINKGDPLFEIETDKVTLTVDSQVDGILTKILVCENTVVPVGEVVGIISVGQNLNRLKEVELNKKPIYSYQVGKPDTIDNSIKEKDKELGIKDGTRDIRRLFFNGEKIKSTPAAKRLAKENGLNLFSVKSKIKKVTIRAQDVKRYLDKEDKFIEIKNNQINIGTIENKKVLENIFEGRRKLTAKKMIKSYREAPHVTLTTRVDMTEIVRLKKKIERNSLQRVTYTDFIILITTKVLKENLIFNSYIIDDNIIKNQDINIGIAVDDDNNLLVPVIKNAEKLNLLEIAKNRQKIIEKVKNNKISIDELNNGTFTITNLGKYTIEIFTPIINPPQTAILGIGQIKEEPTIQNREIKVRSMMWLNLSFDHRIVDGALAARFLQNIKSFLERPDLKKSIPCLCF